VGRLPANLSLRVFTQSGPKADISLRGYFGTRALIAFARASWVMRPATSAGSRARIRILSNSASPGAIAAIAWLTVAAIMAGRPKVFEVNKRSLHSDLSNFDRMEIGIHPQAPQRLH